MCDNFHPIRDLDVIMRGNQYIRFILPENRINDSLFNENCNKTRINNMNNNQFKYHTSLYQYQNQDRIEPMESNFIDVSNDLQRNQRNSCT